MVSLLSLDVISEKMSQAELMHHNISKGANNGEANGLSFLVIITKFVNIFENNKQVIVILDCHMKNQKCI